jgi:tetratricopeptide (TPR) repeat protein
MKPPTYHANQSRHAAWIAAAVLVVAIGLSYANSFRVPLLLDDANMIAENPTIRQLRPIGPVLAPPPDVLSAGRPVLNLSLALNYAFGGLRLEGYHLVNLLIHLGSAALLFGLVRRTLNLPALRERFGADAIWLALIIAVLWAVHPLQTASVTYLSQRAESLMGFFYLATFYGFVRGATSERPLPWHALTVGACALGMATKEVMVTAPFLLLTYERAFLANSFRAIGRERGRVGLYAALAATWLLLAYLIISSGIEERGVGLRARNFTPWSYALVELQVVPSYLKLALWPHPLIFDYGPNGWAQSWGAVLPGAALIAVLIAGSLIGWWRRRGLGWLGVAFLGLLAPTSSFVPVQFQPMAENRMYLPLAAVVAAVVLTGHRLFRRHLLLVPALGAVALGGLTVLRNQELQDALNLWTQTVAQRPANSRALSNLGERIDKLPGRDEEALAIYEKAVRLDPTLAHAHYNLATLAARMPGREAKAAAHFEIALRLNPRSAVAHYNFADLLARLPSREAEAADHYEAALRLNPTDAAAHNNYGLLLSRLPGRENDAQRHFEAASRLDPRAPTAHFNLGNLLARLPGREADAVAQYELALRLDPNLTKAHNNLATLLARLPGRETDAAVHYEAAVRLNPRDEIAHSNYGALLARLPGRAADAIARYEAALRLNPEFLEARFNLAAVLATQPGRLAEAIAQLETILRARPDFRQAHDALQQLRAQAP